MRQLLIDHARIRRAAKRAGGIRVPIEDFHKISWEDPDHLIAVGEALAGLTSINSRAAEIMELTVFGGLSDDDAAEILKMSRASYFREKRAARVFLARLLKVSAKEAPLDRGAPHRDGNLAQ